MHTTTNAQFGLLDSLMASTPANDFLERLDRTLDWRPIEAALQGMCIPLRPVARLVRRCCCSK
jgi:hypothetical protein